MIFCGAGGRGFELIVMVFVELVVGLVVVFVMGLVVFAVVFLVGLWWWFW